MQLSQNLFHNFAQLSQNLDCFHPEFDANRIPTPTMDCTGGSRCHLFHKVFLYPYNYPALRAPLFSKKGNYPATLGISNLLSLITHHLLLLLPISNSQFPISNF